jgi:hypothetical protein
VIKSNYVPLLILAGLAAVSAHADTTAYSSIQSPLPPGIVSEGFQCCQTDQLGNLVQTAAAGTLTTASVVLDDWTYMSQWAGGWGPAGNPTEFSADPSGFTVPMTLTLYHVGAGNTVGAAFASVQTVILVPWRPEPDTVNCPPGAGNSNNDYFSGGKCYTGSTSLANFDFSAQNVILPSQFIYGLAYNTQTYGANPLGYSSPVNSLNVGLTTTGPTVGSDLVPGTAYASDDSTGHVFMQEGGWAPYSVEAQFNVTPPAPEPSTFAFVGIGLAGLAAAARKKASRAK